MDAIILLLSKICLLALISLFLGSLAFLILNSAWRLYKNTYAFKIFIEAVRAYRKTNPERFVKIDKWSESE